MKVLAHCIAKTCEIAVMQKPHAVASGRRNGALGESGAAR
jgi:hypothetical protein